MDSLEFGLVPLEKDPIATRQQRRMPQVVGIHDIGLGPMVVNDYSNWRNGEPNDCCKSQTGNIGEIYGEIQKSDGKWNDIFHQHDGNIQEFPAVYKLNVTYQMLN